MEINPNAGAPVDPGSDDGTNNALIAGAGEDTLRTALQTEVVRKKHWRTKAESATAEKDKWEKMAKDLEAKLNAGAPAATVPQNQPGNMSMQEVEQKLQLQIGGHSPTEVDQIARFAKANGVSIVEAANDPIVKASILVVRGQKTAEAAAPNPSDRTAPIVNKPFSQLSTVEKKAGYADVMKKLVDKARTK